MKKLLAFMVCVSMSLLYARYHNVRSESDFKEYVNKYPFVVACFYESRPFEDQRPSKEFRQDIRDLQSMIKKTAKTGDFGDWLKKEVGFLGIDVSKNRLKDLDEEYNVDRFPAILLIKQGKVVSTMLGGPVELVGFVSKHDLLEFVHDAFGSELKEIVDDKEEQERRDQQERIARYNYYASRWSWGPYGAWGPWYYDVGPNRHYHYRRWGYGRPGVYFGVVA